VKIVLLCHYFAPEPGAPQARLLETARTWVAMGHEVTVLTAFPNHPEGILRDEDRGRLYREEWIDGIHVRRSWVYATPNRGIVKKTLGHLSLMATSCVVSGARTRRPDVVVVSSPTFFSVFSAWALARRFHCPFVFEVRDLWPAIFTELGILTNRTAIRLLEGMEMALYRRAARVVTVTEGFRRNIAERGIPAEKIETITNGVDLGRFRPAPDRDGIRRRLGVEGRFVVLYIGAHGISHALSRILEVAERRKNDPEMLFLFVGEGAAKPDLVREARARGLTNVEFRPAVGKDEVADCYAAADVCLVPLRDVPLFTTFIPSKMFEIMGCGRPIVASLAGEAAEILTASGGALVTGPEDVRGIDEHLGELRASPERREALSKSGAAYVREHYDRKRLAKRYLSVLSAAVEERR
jgi:glycosyltransferase involved in cell wall biosynthesis